MTDNYDEESSGDASDELEQALLERKRRREMNQQMQGSNNIDYGGVISNGLVGLGELLARRGGNPAQAYQNAKKSRDAGLASQAKLRALDDTQEMKGLTTLAQLRQKQAGLDQKPELLKQKQDGTVANLLTKLELSFQNQKALATVMGAQKESLAKMQQAHDEQMKTLHEQNVVRGQDLNQDRYDADRAARSGDVESRIASLERIAADRNQTTRDTVGQNNQTKMNLGEQSNQTKKDLAKLKSAAGGGDASGRNGPVAKDRLQLQANQKYEQTMHNTESQLYAANRVSKLIGGIKSGDLVGTSQLKSDLSGALASMLNNGKTATVYGMSHQDFNSAYGDVQKMYGYLTGETPGTITDEQLNQLGKDIQALRKEYELQHSVTFNSFTKGLPDSVTPKLVDRYNYFRNSMVDSSPESRPNKVVKSGGIDVDMVSVISPEGKPGRIPKSNLDKAVKRGFKLAQ